MKRTADLSGRELDHYVALALGAEMTRDTLANEDKTGFRLSYREHGKPAGFYLVDPSGIVSPWNPSSNWWIGGEIIDRKRMNFATIGTGPADENGNEPIVAIPAEGRKAMTGPTHLIATMRAVVASVYGEEVPE